ncbi:Protein of unknown function [Gryllus bimaculatus]|nr:Protein of unknown function [Gryllus bimaculatus]
MFEAGKDTSALGAAPAGGQWHLFVSSFARSPLLFCNAAEKRRRKAAEKRNFNGQRCKNILFICPRYTFMKQQKTYFLSHLENLVQYLMKNPLQNIIINKHLCSSSVH